MDGTPIIIKKKKHAEHGHHGGSWKVAYADFVTAMMAFFMVMWIMGLSDETKAQISGYFNDPLGYSKTEPLSDNIVKQTGMEAPKPGSAKELGGAAFEQDKEKIQALGRELEGAIASSGDLKTLLKHIDFQLTEEGLRIEFVEDAGAVFFDSGRATIKPVAKKLIMKVAPLLGDSKRQIIIEGHTDAVPYAGAGYDNLDLSTDRALALRRALQWGGVSVNQFDHVRGYADKKLRFPSQPRNPANRRVTVLLPLGIIRDSATAAPEEMQLEPGLKPQSPDLAGDWGAKTMPQLQK